MKTDLQEENERLKEENERLKEENEEYKKLFNSRYKRPYAKKYLEEQKKKNEK